MSGNLAKARELTIIADREHQVAIDCGEGLVGDDVGVRSPVPLRRVPRDQEVQALVRERGYLGIQQSKIDELTAAGLLSLVQRRQDGAGCVHSRHQVGHRNANFLRSPTWLTIRHPGDTHQTTHCLDHRVIAWP